MVLPSQIHELIREYFPSLNSDFVDRPAEEGGKGVRVFVKPKGGKRAAQGFDARSAPPWPRGRPEYIRFVLTKQNMVSGSLVVQGDDYPGRRFIVVAGTVYLYL